MKINFNKIFKYEKLICFCVIFLLCFAVISPSLAQDSLLDKTGLSKAGGTSGLPITQTPTTLIGVILGALAYLASTLLLILIIYGGYLWMTAGGNEEKVGQGRKYIIWAIIGYLIIGASYIIINFIITSI